MNKILHWFKNVNMRLERGGDIEIDSQIITFEMR